MSEWVSVDSLDAVAYSDHRLLDARSLAMHCKIARKISKDQSLLAIPQRNLERWRQRASGEPSKFIAEWQDILDEPWPGVMVFITGCSEKAMRLRQSSPFSGVLSARERKRIYDAFRD